MTAEEEQVTVPEVEGVIPVGTTVLNGADAVACAVQPLAALWKIKVYVPGPEPVVLPLFTPPVIALVPGATQV